MKCQHCNQNEATVFLTTVEGQKLSKLCLCSECAASKGISKDHLTIPTLSSLMAGEAESTQPVQASAKAIGAMLSAKQLRCTSCGHTLMDFKKTGRLGCVHCYEVFGKQLSDLLQGMHQGTEHLGKVARGFSQGQVLGREIEHLKKALNTAIRSEHYEDAAQLRDRIQALQQKLYDHGEEE